MNLFSGFCLLFIASHLQLQFANGEWVQVWEDCFGSGQLTDNWEFEWGCGGWGNNELQCYTNNRPENAKIEDGRLVITAVKEPWKSMTTGLTYNFTSARIKSKVSWLYGRFEARMKLPRGTHLWSGNWLRPRDRIYGSNPMSGEMDICEYKGQNTKEFLGTIHYGAGTTSGLKGKLSTDWLKFDFDLSQDFHDYVFDWSPQNVTWYVDGVELYSISLARNFWPGFYTQNVQPFDQPFYLTFNTAVGGKFFTDPFVPDMADSWEDPTFEVDHVRVYEWN